MPDEDLRALERRARASGSVADEAAWLLARVRGGTLGLENLRLAAYLGHSAAVEALGRDAPVAELDELAAWAGSLGQWGSTLLLRAGLAAATPVLPIWEAAWPKDGRPREALEAVTAWLADPGSRTAGELRRTGQAAFVAQRDANRAAAAANAAAQTALGAAHDDASRLATRSWRRCGRATRTSRVGRSSRSRTWPPPWPRPAAG